MVFYGIPRTSFSLYCSTGGRDFANSESCAMSFSFSICFPLRSSLRRIRILLAAHQTSPTEHCPPFAGSTVSHSRYSKNPWLGHNVSRLPTNDGVGRATTRGRRKPNDSVLVHPVPPSSRSHQSNYCYSAYNRRIFCQYVEFSTL